MICNAAFYSALSAVAGLGAGFVIGALMRAEWTQLASDTAYAAEQRAARAEADLVKALEARDDS